MTDDNINEILDQRFQVLVPSQFPSSWSGKDCAASVEGEQTRLAQFLPDEGIPVH